VLLDLATTDALEAHRNDLGSRVLIGRGAEASPPRRFDPFPAYVVDWTEVVQLALSVATLTQETQTGRVIYGPFRLGAVLVQQSGADLRNCKVAIALTDNDLESSVPLDLLPTTPNQYISDTTEQTPGLNAALAGNFSHGSQTVHRGTGRVSMVVMNQTAATISVCATVHVHHLRPVTADLYP